MTLSSLKVILSCFAVAAFVATVMTLDSSSETSAGLKGSARKLQFSFVFPPANPSLAVDSIFFNSNAILTALNPAISAAPPPGAATVAVNTVAIQSAQIFKGFNP
jgi:hypothetical protein